MENEKNTNAVATQDKMSCHNGMKPLQLKDHLRSRDDIMSCRLKNRERQRRYRARKRLEAELKKASVLNEFATPQEHLEQNGNHNSYRSILHCKRNWKKDARKAHVCKTFEVSNGSATSAFAFDSKVQAQFLAAPMAGEPPVESKNHSENLISLPSSETRTKLGRRDWKAEARRKKN